MKITLNCFVLFLTFLLIGCTGNNTETIQPDPVEPFKLGAILPLTGGNAFFGEYARIGIDLAVEDINTAGGINGRNVIVVYEDAPNPGASVTAAHKLIDSDQVDSMFVITTPLASGVVPITEEAHVLTAYQSVLPSLTNNKKYIFMDYIDYGRICAMLGPRIAEQHKKIALFGTNAEFTTLCKGSLEKHVTLADYEVYNFGDVDFRTQITKIAATNSTAMVMSAYAQDCKGMYKIMKEMSFKPQIYAPAQSTGCGRNDVSQEFKDLLVNGFGADIALRNDSTNPQFKVFQTRAQKSPSIITSAIVYDTIMALAKAWNGCTDVDCAAKNLRTLNFDGPSGHVAFSGQTSLRELAFVQFENDSWKVVQ